MCDPTTTTAACWLGSSLLSVLAFGFVSLVSFVWLFLTAASHLALIIHHRREE
jgi:hypothetical protein